LQEDTNLDSFNLSVSPSGKQVLTGAYDSTFHICDLENKFKTSMVAKHNVHSPLELAK